MDRLVRYVLTELYGEQPGDAPAVRLMALVAERTAQLAASYMAAGFVHGVLNSDNINVTGESFDYGPWRFAPNWDASFTAAYFDHQGLYAFGRQPQAIHWDAAQLALSLTTLAPQEALAEALDTFPAAYEAAFVEKMLTRLGVVTRGDRQDLALVQALDRALATGGVGVDRLFFDWRGGTPRQGGYDADPFTALTNALAGYDPVPGALDHPYWSDPAPCSMLIDEVEAIWAPIADADDWTTFTTKLATIRRMGDALRT